MPFVTHILIVNDMEMCSDTHFTKKTNGGRREELMLFHERKFKNNGYTNVTVDISQKNEDHIVVTHNFTFPFGAGFATIG